MSQLKSDIFGCFVAPSYCFLEEQGSPFHHDDAFGIFIVACSPDKLRSQGYHPILWRKKPDKYIYAPDAGGISWTTPLIRPPMSVDDILGEGGFTFTMLAEEDCSPEKLESRGYEPLLLMKDRGRAPTIADLMYASWIAAYSLDGDEFDALQSELGTRSVVVFTLELGTTRAAIWGRCKEELRDSEERCKALMAECAEGTEEKQVLGDGEEGGKEGGKENIAEDNEEADSLDEEPRMASLNTEALEQVQKETRPPCSRDYQPGSSKASENDVLQPRVKDRPRSVESAPSAPRQPGLSAGSSSLIPQMSPRRITQHPASCHREETVNPPSRSSSATLQNSPPAPQNQTPIQRIPKPQHPILPTKPAPQKRSRKPRRFSFPHALIPHSPYYKKARRAKKSSLKNKNKNKNKSERQQE